MLHPTSTRLIRACSLVVACLLLIAFGKSFVCASGSDDTDTVDQLEDLRSEQYMITSLARGMLIADKNADIVSPLPAASKLMTAIIALEQLPLDAHITISHDIEALDENARYSLGLLKGERRSVEFLVLSLLYYDSDAAAVCLAEGIAKTQDDFVLMMNDKASSLRMQNTNYTHPAGIFSALPDASQAPGQSTPDDLMRLFRYALGDEAFYSLFTSHRKLVFLPDGTPHTLTSEIALAWGLSDAVQGACAFSSKDYRSAHCVLVVAKKDGLDVAILLNPTSEQALLGDLYHSIAYIYDHFVLSPLVAEGEHYRLVRIDSLNLEASSYFPKTTRYAHPIGDDYLSSETDFIPLPELSLPLYKSDIIGHVVFYLDDGSSLIAELAIADDYFADPSVSLFLIERVADTPALTVLLLLTISLFLVVGTVKIVRFFRRRARDKDNL